MLYEVITVTIEPVVVGQHGAANFEHHPSGPIKQGLTVKKAVLLIHLKGHGRPLHAAFPASQRALFSTVPGHHQFQRRSSVHPDSAP